MKLIKQPYQPEISFFFCDICKKPATSHLQLKSLVGREGLYKVDLCAEHSRTVETLFGQKNSMIFPRQDKGV